MAFPPTKLPLHQRARSTEAETLVRNRYRRVRDIAAAQVHALQSDPSFSAEAQQWYARGCKDWFIVSVIVNVMCHQRIRELGVDLHRPERRREIELQREKLPSDVTGRVFPTVLFCGSSFERMAEIFEITALRSAGFELRSPEIEPELVRIFLRDRMDFYSFDLPHAPLFGRPPGHWPELG